MANIPGEIIWQGNNDAWFTTNASTVYPANIQIFHIDGRYKFTDGVTTLSALPFLGETKNLQAVTDLGANTTNQMQINGVNVATVNDLPSLLGYEQTTNKTSTITGNETSTTLYTTVKGVVDWVTGLFVKKGTLTTNTIPKATASDTIGDSQITDDGTNVGIGTNSPIVKCHVNGDIFTVGGSRSGNVVFGAYTFWGSASNEITTFKSSTGSDLKLQELGGGDVLLPNTSSKLNIANLTASQIVETDSSKNLISAAKGTAYNKNFGTTAGTVLEGNAITQTITNGVTDKAPSEDAVFDALALKLTATNNLSDLSNPLTARNNLKEWDLIITTGNQSTTSNVATNITDLVSPTLTANKRYDFEGHINTSCNNTGGVKFQVTLPTGATIAACFDGSIGTNATFQSSIVSASATLTGFSFIQFNGSNIIKVFGQVLLGGTAGNIKFGFASGTNTQTSTINQLGTHIKLKQLD